MTEEYQLLDSEKDANIIIQSPLWFLFYIKDISCAECW